MQPPTLVVWVCIACPVLIACNSTASHYDGGGGGDGGGSRGRGATKCPADVREEMGGCLRDYKEQLDALDQTDDRFFPGLDVEVIRSLCSQLEYSIKCAQVLNEACKKTEQRTIEEELSPHFGVNKLCQQQNIYEEYAMNQNCFVRIRSESESCHQTFQRSIRVDEHSNSRSSSSSLSLSGQRHHATQQQRQYCSHVSQLINCVKSRVRTNTNSCSKNALNLVGHLVRASMTSSIVCSDEQNATSSSPPRQAVVANPGDGGKSSGVSVTAAFRFSILLFVAVSLCFSSVLSSTNLPLHHRRLHHHVEQQQQQQRPPNLCFSLTLLNAK